MHKASQLRSELPQFFTSYQLAFDSLDAEALPSHYRIPASIDGVAGPQVYSSRIELAAQFESVYATFKDMGYIGAQFSLAYYREIGDIGTIIDLGWRLQPGKGKRDFRATYMCVVSDQQWCIFSALAYEGPYDQNA